MTDKKLMNDETMVEFGDRKFPIRILPSRKSTQWRNQMNDTGKTIVKIATNVDSATSNLVDDDGNQKKLQDMSISDFAMMIFDSMEDLNYVLENIPDMVIKYFELMGLSEDDITYIDENGIDPQFLSVFLRMAKLAYPFYLKKYLLGINKQDG